MKTEPTETLAAATQAALLPPRIRAATPPPELSRLPRLYPPAAPPGVNPEPTTEAHFAARKLAAEVQLRVMHAATISRAASVMLSDPGWPVSGEADAEHRGHFARLIDTAQTAHRETLGLLLQLLDELHRD